MESITNNQARNLEHVISMGVRKAIESAGISREQAREILDSIDERNALRELAMGCMEAALRQHFALKDGITREAG